MTLLLLLCACGAANTTAQTPIHLRNALHEQGACGFRLDLRADYGDYVRDFSLDCRGDGEGSASLKVLEPEVAAGIRAEVSGEDAAVSYLDTVLAVEQFTSRALSPMAAPGLLTACWGGGYIAEVLPDGELEETRYLLGYGGRQLEISTWFQGEIPCRAEISDGSQVLITCDISDFYLIKKADDNGNQEDAEADLGGGGPEQPQP